MQKIYKYKLSNKNKNKKYSLQMKQEQQPDFHSFRITTKKKQSIRYYSEEKDSSSSGASSFSSQYNLLTKKLKLKGKNLFKANQFGSTISSFCGKTSFRIRTQSTYSKMMHDRTQNNLLFVPIKLNEKQKQYIHSQNFRHSTAFAKGSTMQKFANSTNKIKKTLKVQKPSIYSQIAEQQKELSLFKLKNKKQQLSISQQNAKSKKKLLENTILLWNIRKQIHQKNNKIKPKEIIKVIKAYILRKEQKDESKNNIQKVFTNLQEQNDLKQLLTYERIIVIGIVELINIQKLHHICVECVNILDNLLGFYKHVLNLLFPSTYIKKLLQSSIGDYQKFCTETKQQSLDTKTSLTSTLLFACTKLHTVYRFSPELFKKVKITLANSKKISMNRSFYDLLTTFAIHLNYYQPQSTLQNPINKYMSSFTTCPSPFIIQPRTEKKYTLVVDLDQTLVNTKFDSGCQSNYCIRYRPNCKQFIIKLAVYYEIIIFTSSISSYANQVIAPFVSSISHVLCRQHTIKIRGMTIKDISRIGRPLQSIIIIDNMSQNYKFQKQNGIEVKSWYGQKNDTQLKRLEKILMKVIQKNPKDIKDSLKLVMQQQNVSL